MTMTSALLMVPTYLKPAHLNQAGLGRTEDGRCPPTCNVQADSRLCTMEQRPTYIYRINIPL